MRRARKVTARISDMHTVRVVQNYSTVRAVCYTEGCKFRGPVYGLCSVHLRDAQQQNAKAQRDAAEHRAKRDVFNVEREHNLPAHAVVKSGQMLWIERR